jgi:hypothetical protein
LSNQRRPECFSLFFQYFNLHSNTFFSPSPISCLSDTNKQMLVFVYTVTLHNQGICYSLTRLFDLLFLYFKLFSFKPFFSRVFFPYIRPHYHFSWISLRSSVVRMQVWFDNDTSLAAVTRQSIDTRSQAVKQYNWVVQDHVRDPVTIPSGSAIRNV